MKLTKLNMRGVAHHFLIMLVVVGIAVGGVYYEVASHANSVCPYSQPYSDPYCQPTSSPTYSVSCIVNGPATVTKGNVYSPQITVTNDSSIGVLPTLTTWYSQVTPAVGSPLQSRATQTNWLDSGMSQTITFNPYNAPFKYTTTIRYSVAGSYYSYVDGFTRPFTCGRNFQYTVPTISSVTIQPADWVTNHAAITTDSPKGNVMAINYTHSTPDATIYTPTVSAQLPKFDHFLAADLGHQVKLCVTARAAKASGLGMGLSVPFASSPLHKNFALTDTYATHCLTTTLEDSTSYVNNFRNYLQIVPYSSSAGTYGKVYVDVATMTFVK